MLLLCLAAPLYAQPAPPGQDGGRNVCVFDFLPLGGAEALWSDLFSDTLAIELEAVGFRIYPLDRLRSQLDRPLHDEAGLLELARGFQANVAIYGFYSIEAGSIHVGIRAYDLDSRLPAIALTESGPAGIEIFDTIDRVAASVAAQVRARLAAPPTTTVIIERPVRVVEQKVVEDIFLVGTPIVLRLLSTHEGAAVYAGDQLLGYISDGELLVETKEGASLWLELRLDGHFSKKLELRASARQQEHRLPRLLPRAGQELVVGLVMQKPFGVSALYNRLFADGRLSWGAESGLFVLPFSFPGSEDELVPDGFAINLPLYAQAAFYPLAMLLADSPLRPYLRLSLGLESYLSIDAAGGFWRGVSLAHLGTGLGLSYTFGSYLINVEACMISPPFLNLGGGSQGMELGYVLLRVGGGYRW